MNKKTETVGSLSLKARFDNTKVDPLDVGYAVNEGVDEQIQECIRIYNKKIDEDEFCICIVLASDPLIKGVVRRKFYAWPYLPSPRPSQAVLLYNKAKDQLVKRLWVLPNAGVMEKLYLATHVPDKYQLMKQWSMAFYDGKFWDFIRYQHDIKMLSEIEYLDANREKLIQAGCQHIQVPTAQPFDFSKIKVDQVINSNKSTLD